MGTYFLTNVDIFSLHQGLEWISSIQATEIKMLLIMTTAHLAVCQLTKISHCSSCKNWTSDWAIRGAGWQIASEFEEEYSRKPKALEQFFFFNGTVLFFNTTCKYVLPFWRYYYTWNAREYTFASPVGPWVVSNRSTTSKSWSYDLIARFSSPIILI